MLVLRRVELYGACLLGATRGATAAPACGDRMEDQHCGRQSVWMVNRGTGLTGSQQPATSCCAQDGTAYPLL
jgi:hypothetical protein